MCMIQWYNIRQLTSYIQEDTHRNLVFFFRKSRDLRIFVRFAVCSVRRQKCSMIIDEADSIHRRFGDTDQRYSAWRISFAHTAVWYVRNCSLSILWFQLAALAGNMPQTHIWFWHDGWMPRLMITWIQKQNALLLAISSQVIVKWQWA